ncbi:MAG: Hsp33 family molecular chaperone HslO [Oscillospiraceae bacterium]|nr:Hsp33 family molecular chaperone HslO [Oscillospiraceae bacterium]
MSTIVRTISRDGGVVCAAIDSTDIAAEAERIHKTSATTTAALGRLLTAGSLMGSMLKKKEESVTLRMSGGGPAGLLLVVSDGEGNVRGTLDNPVVEIPLNNFGKLDVAGAVGREGTLSVVKDLGLKDPYVGQVPIVSGEIAEDIANYYAVSEQIPTVCALGVLVNPDLTVKAAGGFLAQLLPGATEEEISRLEANIQALPAISKMIAEGLTPEQMAARVLDGFEPEVLDSFEVGYRCDCSRERVERALISVGSEDLEQLAQEQEITEVCCHFCDKKYHFTAEDLRRLLRAAR